MSFAITRIPALNMEEEEAVEEEEEDCNSGYLWTFYNVHKQCSILCLDLIIPVRRRLPGIARHPGVTCITGPIVGGWVDERRAGILHSLENTEQEMFDFTLKFIYLIFHQPMIG